MTNSKARLSFKISFVGIRIAGLIRLSYGNTSIYISYKEIKGEATGEVMSPTYSEILGTEGI